MKTYSRPTSSFCLKASVFLCGFLIFSGISKSNVYKNRINAHWSEDNSHFWYRNDLAKGHREFVLVDVTKGHRRLAFDHEKVAASLAKITQTQIDAGKLPIDGLSFDLNKNTVSFRGLGRSFLCDLLANELTELEKHKGETKEKDRERKSTKNQRRLTALVGDVM